MSIRTDWQLAMKFTHGPSTLAWTLVGSALIGLAALVTPRYRVLYNASDSAPRGWYVLVPTNDVRLGTLVFAQLPENAATLAAERGYLPNSVPILKQVAATRGDYVCTKNRVLTINDVPTGRALESDGAGRRLDYWTHCRSLEDGELFLLGTGNAASFDSRYFGPVNVAAITGRAIPLWTW